jgi:hypothetical protein
MIYFKGFLRSIRGGYFDFWLFQTIQFIKFDYYVKMNKHTDYIRVEKVLSKVSRNYWKAKTVKGDYHE